jgi:hypothetical protein
MRMSRTGATSGGSSIGLMGLVGARCAKKCGINLVRFECHAAHCAIQFLRNLSY